MNILYLHGLDSSLNAEKRLILEKFGTVLGPEIDYRKDENSIESLLNTFRNKDINVVIGSSMGGFAGYYIAQALQRPALLFNPALAKRSVPQAVPNYPNGVTTLKHIVLGANDDVIDPKSTLNFLANSLGSDNYTIKVRQGLGHRIPEEIFEEEIKAFFKKLR